MKVTNPGRTECYMALPDGSVCSNCGSDKGLMGIACESEKKGLPLEEVRIACRKCYDFSVKNKRLPRRDEL